MTSRPQQRIVDEGGLICMAGPANKVVYPPGRNARAAMVDRRAVIAIVLAEVGFSLKATPHGVLIVSSGMPAPSAACPAAVIQVTWEVAK